jgi:formylglycine-generating enzyme required for sulfatase activity
MNLVEGRYCPEVKHRCEQHTKEYEQTMKKRAELRAQGLDPGPKRVVERCLRYAKPGRCLSAERRELRFCMDRYEWPNRVGEKPRLLVNWTEAKAKCERAGKRLCTADEFNFACEGEDLLPYGHGYERRTGGCNMDRPYVTPKRQLLSHDACVKAPWCKRELEALDQRVPIGSTRGCTSPFGLHDLNGNVNEWVERPGQQAPKRSGLKGGWWGPARSRCRPMVTAHDENYVGYEVGFRCCSDAP